MSLTPRVLLVGVLSLLVSVASADAQQDTQRYQVLSDMGKQFNEWRKNAGDQATADIARENANQMIGVTRLEIAALNVWEIKLIADVLEASSSGAAAKERLVELSVIENADGAAAAAMAVNFTDMDDISEPEKIAAFSRVLKHPFLGALLAAGSDEGIECFWTLAEETSAHRTVLDGIKGDLPALVSAMSDINSRDIIAAVTGVTRAMAEAGAGYDSIRVPLRGKLQTLAQAGLERAPEKDKVRWQRLLNLINSQSMDGPVVGRPAAPLTITWSNDEHIKSFDDLKGKVVVIDFWATWCPPCNASFPNVRKLKEHYDGYPVVILGVTSLQGRHIGPKGPIDTKGEPEKEYELMPEFVARKQLTWPIVFTDQPAHNPDYGVVGIPHVAIIDPAGVVRYNALSPFEPLEEKAAKIDGLLREFKLETPAAVTAQKTAG